MSSAVPAASELSPPPSTQRMVCRIVGPARSRSEGLRHVAAEEWSEASLMDAEPQPLFPPWSIDFRQTQEPEEDQEMLDLCMGMTPTPSKTVECSDTPSSEGPFLPTPTLNGLLEEELPAETNPVSQRRSDSIPSFSRPEDAAAYLSRGRDDLDMELQRRLKGFHDQELRGDRVGRLQREATLSEDNRQYALTSLVSEAAWLALQRLRGHRRQPECSTAWRKLLSQVQRDHTLEGALVPQRNLSCMCIFSVLNRGGAFFPPPYGDAEGDRSRRVAAQVEILRAIGLQRALGSTSLFLRSPEVDYFDGEMTIL